jgi:hypothetical protein
MPAGSNQSLIVTHAVLAGLTPLIPIPILDDLAKSYFKRRLVRSLAKSKEVGITEKDVRQLIDDQEGCLKGCALGTVLFPLKLIFRKTFYFLEWKRAVDTASLTYHQGLLLNYALEQGWFPPFRDSARVRAAVDAVCREAGTGPVNKAVGMAMRQSRTALTSGAELLKKSMQRSGVRRDDEKVAIAAEQVEAEEQQAIKGVTSRMNQLIADIPPEYFDKLRARLKSLLEMP